MSQGHGLRAAQHLTRQLTVERIHRSTRQRLILGEQVEQDLLVGVAPVLHEGDEAGHELARRVGPLVEQRLRDVPLAVDDVRDELVGAQQVMDAGDHHTQSVGGLREAEHGLVGEQGLKGDVVGNHVVHSTARVGVGTRVWTILSPWLNWQWETSSRTGTASITRSPAAACPWSGAASTSAWGAPSPRKSSTRSTSPTPSSGSVSAARPGRWRSSPTRTWSTSTTSARTATTCSSSWSSSPAAPC